MPFSETLVSGSNNHVTLRVIYFTFFSCSDAQSDLQRIALTRSTGLKALSCSRLIG